MKTTANFGLKKPEGTDVVNIDDLNYNADIIDTELQKRVLKTDIPTVPVQSVNGKTGAVTLVASDVGAASVTDFVSHKADNTKHVAKDGTLQTGLNSDKVDGLDLRIYNGSLQYNDGSGWKDIMAGLIQPTKPMNVIGYLTNIPTGAINTLLDVSSGSGKLSRISIRASASINSCNVKITVDGGIPFIINSRPAYNIYSAGFSRSSNFESINVYDYFGEIYFKNSLKIELVVANGPINQLDYTIDYSLI